MLLEIRYPSKRENISRFCQAVTDLAKKTVAKKSGQKLAPKFLQEVELMTGEACTNSICHNPAPNSGEVILKIRSYQNIFKIIVMDQNPAFDFYNFRQPEFDDAPESGYGLHIIKTLADKVIYQRENNRNILSMTKKINHR